MLNSIWTRLATAARGSTQIRTVRRFVRRQDGATAVEFGMVALPFFAVLFAIVETAIVLFAGQVLENAVADAARLILTGQAQKAGFNQQSFKNDICTKIFGLFDCANGLTIDVKSFPSFANITLPSPIDAEGKFVDNSTFQPGGASQIVVVRMFYAWPIYTSFFGSNPMQNLAGGKRLLTATAAFRNEPF